LERRTIEEIGLPQQVVRAYERHHESTEIEPKEAVRASLAFVPIELTNGIEEKCF
jgi:hypothetical protein